MTEEGPFLKGTEKGYQIDIENILEENLEQIIQEIQEFNNNIKNQKINVNKNRLDITTNNNESLEQGKLFIEFLNKISKEEDIIKVLDRSNIEIKNESQCDLIIKKFNISGTITICGNFNNITFENSNFERLNINDTTLNSINIIGGKDSGKGKNISLNNAYFNKLEINYVNVIIIKILYNSEYSNELLKNKKLNSRILDSEINKIDYKGVNHSLGQLNLNSINFKNNGNLEIKKLNFNEVVLNNIDMTEDTGNILSFSKLSNLSIDQSNLGKTNFFNINIDKIDIKKSILLDCIFNNTTFPKINKINTKEDIQQYDKDTCRQMKVNLDRSGNYTEANKFFSKEMEIYGKKIDNIWDKLLFGFQKIISNFGTNRIKPLISLLILAFIFSIIMKSDKNFG